MKKLLFPIRPYLLLVACCLMPNLSAESETEKLAREAMDVAQGKVERINVAAIATIRRFGHEIQFDDLYLNLAFGFSGREGSEKQFDYSFHKFGFILLEDAIVFDDFRYFPLAPGSVLKISDHGRVVTIGGLAKEPVKLPSGLKEILVNERELSTASDGIKVEVVGSLGTGGSGHPFGPGQWIGTFGVMPVRIWDGEFYVGRKHLGKVNDLAKNSLIRVDASTGSVLTN